MGGRLTQPGQADEYRQLREGLRYAVHELPSGVLWGPNGATQEQCGVLMEDVYRFQKLSHELGRDDSGFIEGCSWHFEHYAHYLSRHRHFRGYADYIERHHGPLKVDS